MTSGNRAAVAIGVAGAAALYLWLRRRYRSTSSAAARKADFLRRSPSYGYRGIVDVHRAAELPGLVPPLGRRVRSREPIVYLDHAGAALPLASQLADVSEAASVVCGNPHSDGPAAARATAALERARRLVLHHFCGEHAHEWELVWTSGATAALRLAAEAFPFAHGSAFVHTSSAHTSVLGMRVPAAAAGAHVHCVHLEDLVDAAAAASHEPTNELGVERGVQRGVALAKDGGGLGDAHRRHLNGGHVAHAPSHEAVMREADHLLVLAAECNLTGDRPPVAPIARAVAAGAVDVAAIAVKPPAVDGESDGESEQGGATGGAATGETGSERSGDVPARGRWWLLLDAAKAGGSMELDVPASGAALAAVSLYKLFGEPTGLGALLVRSDLAQNLRRRGMYYGGGAVSSVLASDPTYHVPKPKVASALAHGTAHFRGALSLPAGFAALAAVGGMQAIHGHTMALAAELTTRLRALRHDTGQRVVVLYGAWGAECGEAEPPLDDRGNVVDETRDGTLPPTEAALRVLPGPTVAFNVVRRSGEHVGYAEVVKLAALRSPPIQLRGGCCCNPGGCQRILQLPDEAVRAAAAAGKQCGDGMDSYDGQPMGVVRASLGKDSIWEDIDELVRFLDETFVAADEDLLVDDGAGALSALEVVGEKGTKQGVASEKDTDVVAGEKGENGEASGCTDAPLLEEGTLESGGHASDASAAETTTAARLSGIFVFPIKSCAAMACEAWWVDSVTGVLLYDREWALVDGCGEVMRLSAHPKLATLRPYIDVHAATLTLECAGMSTPLVLPIGDAELSTGAAELPCSTSGMCAVQPADETSTDARQVDVCGKVCEARECGGAEAARWLAQALGVQCRLVRHAPAGGAAASGARARDKQPSDGAARDTPGADGVAFANEAPLLLLTQSAVDELNRAMRASGEPPVSAMHFRPNLVLDGVAQWSVAQHAPPQERADGRLVDLADGAVQLRVVGPCARCAMVEIDPTSGARHGAVLRTLAKHHRVRSRLLFGFFCEPVASRPCEQTRRTSGGELVELRTGSVVDVRANA